MAKQPNRRQVFTRTAFLIAAVLIVIVVVLLVIASIVLGQTGFDKKTLWDWMDLALTPAVLAGVLAGAVWWLDKKRAETDQASTLDRMREDRLQAYLVAMKELMLDYKVQTSSEAQQIARALTLTVLPNLDGRRKGNLLRFLHESKLISKDSPIIPLNNADLSNAYLKAASLQEINLQWTYMPEANLDMADLRKANLNGAFLHGAILYIAVLHEADLRNANLLGAKLLRADLTGADLTGAYLDGADLRGAYLGDAIYNDATSWPDGFDPVKKGAKKIEPEPPDEVNADESKQL